MSTETKKPTTLCVAVVYLGIVCIIVVAGKIVTMAVKTTKKIRARYQEKKAAKLALKIVEGNFQVQ
jgi:hypothetical protein